MRGDERMNQLILGYVRITCYAALYCMSLLIKAMLVGNVQKEALEYLDVLMGVQQELDKEADKVNE